MAYRCSRFRDSQNTSLGMTIMTVRLSLQLWSHFMKYFLTLSKYLLVEVEFEESLIDVKSKSTPQLVLFRWNTWQKLGISLKLTSSIKDQGFKKEQVIQHKKKIRDFEYYFLSWSHLEPVAFDLHDIWRLF